MPNHKPQPRLTSFAPQFLVDDLVRSMTYYQKLGFTFGDPWDGFYAIGERDGLEVHLKEAPKNPSNESTGANTNISMRRRALTASRRSTASASRMARRLSGL